MMTQNIPPRNVLNVEDADAFAKAAGNRRAPHIKAWWNSTYRKWLLQDSPYAIPVLDQRDLNTGMAALMRAMLSLPGNALAELAAKHTHMVDVATLPDWAQKALQEKAPLVYLRLPVTTGEEPEAEAARQKLIHMNDYMETLPEKQMRQTVPDLEEAVRLWTVQLSRQKMVGSLVDGVAYVESAYLETYAQKPLMMVRLVSEQSYKNEGAIMKHCVGNGSYYRDRKNRAIYSLRQAEVEIPLATIEVRRRYAKTKDGKPGTEQLYIVQIQAFRDRRPDEWILEVVRAWAKEANIDSSRASLGGGDDEEEDDYDDDDEEYDDDDEEDDEEFEFNDPPVLDEPRPTAPVPSVPAIASAPPVSFPAEADVEGIDAANNMQEHARRVISRIKRAVAGTRPGLRNLADE